MGWEIFRCSNTPEDSDTFPGRAERLWIERAIIMQKMIAIASASTVLHDIDIAFLGKILILGRTVGAGAGSQPG